MFAQPGSPERCSRCDRRLSRRSADAFGCPWCEPRADVADGLRQPAPGETPCFVSETAANIVLTRGGSSQVAIIVHGRGDCSHFATDPVETSVAAVRDTVGDRSISVRGCTDCGGGLL